MVTLTFSLHSDDAGDDDDDSIGDIENGNLTWMHELKRGPVRPRCFTFFHPHLGNGLEG